MRWLQATTLTLVAGLRTRRRERQPAHRLPGPPSEEGPDAPLPSQAYVPPTDEPKLVTSDDEASFRPGPLPKKPVTQGGKPGGGAGGGARGGRKPLGDQSRAEAYDPTLDRADPRNVALTDEQGRVNPKQWERAQKGAIDPTAPGERTGEAAAKFTNQYTNALAGATKYMEDLFHQKKGDKNQPEGYAALTFKATGAPDPQVVNDVFKVVDPNNELQPGERMELATRAMHDWYSARGDKTNADKVAAEMLQHGNKQAQGHGNNALALMKKGDRQGAIAEIQKAYDWLPDGYRADVKGNNLVIADNKGKVINNIPLDDKMIANLGTGLATGTLYWDVVQDRAGSKEKFGPPKAAPTQAIATGAPGGAPATPAAPPPAAAPGGAPPAPAAPAALPAPQTAGAPSAAPPPAPRPPVAPPAAVPPPPAPPTTSPPLPPQAPPVTRPAAPAPAAPGPAPTTQAAPPPPPAVTAQPPVTPAQGGGEPTINTSVPPPLQGPVQPTTTKRPVVEEPEKKPAAPASPTPTPGPATKSETKPAEPPPADKTGEQRFVYPKDDPDSVPIDRTTGKPAVFRRTTADVTPEVREAHQKIAEADALYRRQQDWLAHKQKTTKGTDAYQRTLVQLRDDIEKTHKTTVDRYKATVAEHKAAQTRADADEKAALKPRYHNDTELTKATSAIDDKLTTYVKAGDKHPLVKNSVLRLAKDEDGAPDPKKLASIRDTILEVHAHNRTGNNAVPLDKVTDGVVTAISHLGSDREGKGQTANDGSGPTASRFRVVAKDVNGNAVVAIGVGDKAMILHMPQSALNEIKRLKKESYEDQAAALKKDQEKHKSRTELKEKGKELFGIDTKKPPGMVERGINKVLIGPKPRDQL